MDVCFLKGPYGGILLVAVAKDPNKQYFPLAWVVVQSETRETWTCFLQLLVNDINGIKDRNWLFIYDQQKVISLICI